MPKVSFRIASASRVGIRRTDHRESTTFPAPRAVLTHRRGGPIHKSQALLLGLLAVIRVQHLSIRRATHEEPRPRSFIASETCIAVIPREPDLQKRSFANGFAPGATATALAKISATPRRLLLWHVRKHCHGGAGVAVPEPARDRMHRNAGRAPAPRAFSHVTGCRAVWSR